MKSRWLPLGFFLLLAFLAGGIGAIATATSVQTWYPTLQKPAWTPPGWLFGPVWTVLYVLMAVAAWRGWREGSAADGRMTVRLFASQLMLNAGWSVAFFGFRRPDLALIDVVVLWLVLLRMAARFRAVDRLAVLLWLPYLAWVSFAVALNAAIWQLNR